jgi:hypothetical protein
MRRTTHASAALLTLALLGALVPSAPAAAQESTTRGFNVGAHLGGSSLQVEDGDRHNAGGGGVLVGYGFNRNFEIFLQMDGAEFDVENESVDGKWTMGHADLGVRYHFANSLRSWVPYVEAALGGRGVSVEDALVQGNPETDVGFVGGAVTLGGGILFYFNETFAAHIQLVWSGGQFTEIKVDNVTVSGLEIDAQSSRLNLGVSWWP